MTARHAFGFIYNRLTAPLTEDSRLEVDALLGDSAAAQTLNDRRREALVEMGVEFG